MKKLYILLVGLILSGNVLKAQNIELSNKLINEYQTAQQKAMSRSATIQDHLWLTPLLLEARLNWSVLTPEAKTVFRRYLDRPNFSGTEKIYDRGNFRFHYTTNGPSGERVSSTDNNPANGVPDYIDQMASKFVDDVYNLYHSVDGFPVPPPDNSLGGNDLFDIYVSGSLAGNWIYGYVSPQFFVYDNPNSATTEYKAVNSYMVMRNNYNGFGNTNIAMSVTAAHEYMHAIQFGIHAYMDHWLLEATATWGEDHVYPGYDDNLQYLMEIFDTPDVALNIASNEAGGTYSQHWYGSWLFFKYATEHTDDVLIKDIYYKCVNNSDNYISMNQIDEVLTQRGSSFKLMFKNFVIANALLSSSNAYAPYTYTRANVYANYVNSQGGLTYENQYSPFNYTGNNISWNSQSNGNSRLMRMSTDYFKMTANTNFKMTVSGTNSENIFVLIKKKNNPAGISVIQANSNGEINVTDAANWNSFIPIVIRFDKNVNNTTAHNYTVNITQATQGIEEYDNKIAIYPNPVNNYLNIQLKDNLDVTINLFDITGKLLLTQQINKAENTINLTNFKQGIYFLTFKKEGQIIKTQRFIIKH